MHKNVLYLYCFSNSVQCKIYICVLFDAQAFNASNILLRDLEYESTIMWLLRQLKHKLVQDNADIAAQVLIALAGKSMVDIHEATGMRNFA